MFPIGDDDSARKTIPLVNYALIALNVLFFVFELMNGDAFIEKWAFVPSRFLANPIGDFLTLFTSMFMHAGWLHLGGNMLYLWIFGDNVEDRFGHGKYLIFYLLCGLAATFAQLAFSTQFDASKFGSIRGYRRSIGRVHHIVSGRKDKSSHGSRCDASFCFDRYWTLDRSAILQRHWFNCQHNHGYRRSGFHGAYRRIRSGSLVDLLATRASNGEDYLLINLKAKGSSQNKKILTPID